MRARATCSPRKVSHHFAPPSPALAASASSFPRRESKRGEPIGCASAARRLAGVRRRARLRSRRTRRAPTTDRGRKQRGRRAGCARRPAGAADRGVTHASAQPAFAADGGAARLHHARRRSAPLRHRLCRSAGLRRRARSPRARSRRRSPRQQRRCSTARSRSIVSGCAKGCAHPGAAALTVVGTRRGCGIVARRLGAAICRARRRMPAGRHCRGDRAHRRAHANRATAAMAEPQALSARRRRDLRALVRHHPRRGRLSRASRPRRPRSRCA